MEYVENSTSRANVLSPTCLRKKERKAELKGAVKEKDCSPSPTPNTSRAIEQVKPRLHISLVTISKSLVS